MNIVREYKEQKNLRLADLKAELEPIQSLDLPTLSRIVNGAVRPNLEVELYIASKAFETASETGFDTSSIKISVFDKNSLKSPFLQNLYDAIACKSEHNPATREYLREKLGVPDRAVRKGIEELRRSGVRVVSLSDRYGYWLDDDYIRFRSQMLGKAFTILKTVKAMDEVAEGQLRWGEPRG